MVLLPFVDLDPDLTALRPLGGFFLLRTAGDPPGALPTLADAYAGRSSHVYGHSMIFRVRKVARSIRAPEERVAASVAHQGLAARLWSIALGCAVLYGRLPDLDPRLVRWDPDAGAPDDLWLTRVRPLPVDRLAEVVLEGHLEPLAAVVRADHRLAPGLLWGNAASALAGAARQLERWAGDHGRPDLVAATRSLAGRLFAHPLLAGTGRLEASGTGAGGPVFRRRSCCLHYRVPGGGVCGDCCFTRPPRSSPHAPSGRP
ncbi:(2Fe-2S)-binding protein [Streptomyces sp. bgisy153]|uniref:(2Fe-2S)-binding protein n=1 Tax=Streptomyces sp. bgisy153 TaxID=3413793 RepID=UPI003D71E0FC